MAEEPRYPDPSVDDLLFYLGKVAARVCAIGAAPGTSGNISVRADGFPLERFPAAGRRAASRRSLGRSFPDLVGKRLLFTGSGKNLRYVADRPHESLALIEIIEGGYEILWGLSGDEPISSEHPAHLATYERRANVATIVHAHPTSVNVFARLFHSEDALNRLLAAQHEQLNVHCPRGIGLIDVVRYGSYELADAVSQSLVDKDICVVVRHGTFAVGEGNPVAALNAACDLQEYYHAAARTFLDNPWLRSMPVEFIVSNLGRIARLPLGDRLVNAFLRSPR